MPVEQDVQYYEELFGDVTKRNEHRRALELEDHRYYKGINFGQWTNTQFKGCSLRVGLY